MTDDFTSGNALITDSRGEILLNLRNDEEGIEWPGYWSVPGGKREPGESPYETARRELREETGLDVEALLPFDVVPHDADGEGRWYFHAVVDVDPSELVLGEGQELRFFPLNDLPEKTAPHIRDYVRQLEGHLRAAARPERSAF